MKIPLRVHEGKYWEGIFTSWSWLLSCFSRFDSVIYGFLQSCQPLVVVDWLQRWSIAKDFCMSQYRKSSQSTAWEALSDQQEKKKSGASPSLFLLWVRLTLHLLARRASSWLDLWTDVISFQLQSSYSFAKSTSQTLHFRLVTHLPLLKPSLHASTPSSKSGEWRKLLLVEVNQCTVWYLLDP